MITFGERLRQLRTNRDISLRELAKQMKVDYSTLSNYEIGKRRPDFDTLVKLANYFDVSTDYLLCRTDDPRGSDDLPKKMKRMRINLGKSVEEFADMLNLTADEVREVEEGRLQENKRWHVWIGLLIGGLYEKGLAKPRGELRTVPILGRVCAGDGSPAKEQILGYGYDSTGQADFILRVEGSSMSPLINDGEEVFVKWQNTAENGDIVVAFINSEDGVVRRFKKYDSIVVLEVENAAVYKETVIDLKENPSWGIIGVVLGKFQRFK